MDIETHYYVTFLIAKQAGFSTQDCYKIAYSSQYVDDNSNSYTIYNSDNHKKYSNIITQTCNIFAPKSFLKKVYTSFHFPPDPFLYRAMRAAKHRKDNTYHTMNTIAGGSLAHKVLSIALKSNNPYSIGIASHTFMDSWAHQNFTGTFHSFNSMLNRAKKHHITNKYNMPLPCCYSIGHMDAADEADTINTQWQDDRLKQATIRNNSRFLAATIALLRQYRSYGTSNKENSNITDKKFMKLISQIFKDDNIRNRVESYYNIYNAIANGTIINKYNSTEWLDEAICNKFDLLRLRSFYQWNHPILYKRSNWYKFQQAAKLHYDLTQRFIKLMYIHI